MQCYCKIDRRLWIFSGAQGVFAFPPSDRDDDHYQDDGCDDRGEDDEDDGYEGASALVRSFSVRGV